MLWTMQNRPPLIEKRLEPNDSPLVIGGITVASIALAMFLGGLLLLPFKVNPVLAYLSMFQQSFGNLKGIGFTLVEATPLIFIALGTIIAWKTGFFYLGFEGTILIGASVAAWVALWTNPGGLTGPLPPVLFFPLVFLITFVIGGLWVAFVGFLKARFGGNEVIVSLMLNYVAVFLVNYLVSGPLRAPGDLPQTARIPDATILPFIIPGTRAHVGILVAIAAAIMVWLLLRKTILGYELIVSGLSPRSARYGGINVGNRQIMAAFLAGGVSALAGLVAVLGVQFRLMDGISQGTGFVGIVVALLGKLNPLGAIVAAILYAGLSVGADAMQRQMGIPSSVITIVQFMIVLFILAGDFLRYYRINLYTLARQRTKPQPDQSAPGETRSNDGN